MSGFAPVKVAAEPAAAAPNRQPHAGVGRKRPSGPEAVRRLQTAYGNQATLRMLRRPASPATSGSWDEDRAHPDLPDEVRTVLRSDGEPLPESVRTTMETRFSAKPLVGSPPEPAKTSSPAAEGGSDPNCRPKADFSRVRIHTGERAAAGARAVQARAFSVGSHIVFNAGAYQPDTWQGWRLLAHELAHVTQPRLTGAPPVSQPGDASEREAGAAADAVASSRPARIGAVPGAIVQRQDDAGSSSAPTPAPAPVRMKYLVLYDASEGEAANQAKQTALDHGTTAHKFDSAKLSDLMKQEQPDVIMTFGHGSSDVISAGTADRKWIGQRTVSGELKESGQTKPTRFVAQACSAGAEKGLMDTLQSDPSLRNFTFVGHTTIRHMTRNDDIRVAGGSMFRDYLIGRVQLELGFEKSSAAEIVRQTLVVKNTKAETAADSSINTVIREVSVLGFERFWELVKVEHPDVANDPAVLELNMTKEARERFAAGIGQFRARMLKAVEEQMKLRIKKPAAAPK